MPTTPGGSSSSTADSAASVAEHVSDHVFLVLAFHAWCRLAQQIQAAQAFPQKLHSAGKHTSSNSCGSSSAGGYASKGTKSSSWTAAKQPTVQPNGSTLECLISSLPAATSSSNSSSEGSARHDGLPSATAGNAAAAMIGQGAAAHSWCLCHSGCRKTRRQLAKPQQHGTDTCGHCPPSNTVGQRHVAGTVQLWLSGESAGQPARFLLTATAATHQPAQGWAAAAAAAMAMRGLEATALLL